MAKEKKNKTTPAGSRNFVQRLFSGNVLLSDFITKQWRYLLFLFALALVYIAFHYNMANTIRAVRRAEREVSNLQAEYATKSSELMRMSKQSEVARMLRDRGISTVTAPKAPPKRIK